MTLLSPAPSELRAGIGAKVRLDRARYGWSVAAWESMRGARIPFFVQRDRTWTGVIDDVAQTKKHITLIVSGVQLDAAEEGE